MLIDQNVSLSWGSAVSGKRRREGPDSFQVPMDDGRPECMEIGNGRSHLGKLQQELGDETKISG